MIKNRGAISNIEGRFETQLKEDFDDGWFQEDSELALDTILYPAQAKTIISRNNSPDIGFDQSINPYKGCEHGCIYCYARPSHAYMNLSPGLDFESKIFYKDNAAQLLRQELSKKNYQCKPIVLGANTDPYQAAEVKLKISRSILEVLHAFRHPVAIITKSSLVTRDMDILSDMAKDNLASVAVSITTLQNDLKRTLEPRASSPMGRLRAIKQLSQNRIPVRVIAAPIIPMINECEIEKILAQAAGAGASHANYVLLRLPNEVKPLFKEWLSTHFPQRANHVMSIIRQMRGGKEYDATFGKRMKGEGEFATFLKQRFHLACKKYKLNQTTAQPLNTDLFVPVKTDTEMSPQLNLWA